MSSTSARDQCVFIGTFSPPAAPDPISCGRAPCAWMVRMTFSRAWFATSCACACACACAGGGRAGCSAKNLYGAIHLEKDSTKKLS